MYDTDIAALQKHAISFSVLQKHISYFQMFVFFYCLTWKCIRPILYEVITKSNATGFLSLV